MLFASTSTTPRSTSSIASSLIQVSPRSISYTCCLDLPCPLIDATLLLLVSSSRFLDTTANGDEITATGDEITSTVGATAHH